MLHLAPSHVPPLADLARDLGNPTAAELARVLGVSERTVWRWLADGGPQSARLALYWLTPWGWSAHEAEARRRLGDYRALVQAQREQIDALAARFARVAALGDFGSANAPLLDQGIGTVRPSITRQTYPDAASSGVQMFLTQGDPLPAGGGVSSPPSSSPSGSSSIMRPPPPQAYRNHATDSSSATS